MDRPERRDTGAAGGVGPHRTVPPDDPEPAAPPPEVRPRMVPGRPTPVVRVSFLLRGLALWVAVHLGMAFLGVVVFSPVQVALVLAVVYLGVRVDQRVRREDILLGNAGVPPWVGPAHAVAATAVAESVAQVVARSGG